MLENFKFRIFIKYFLIFACFLLVPFFAISLYLASYVMTQYKEQVYEQVCNSIDYISNRVDDELSKTRKMEAKVIKDKSIEKYMTMTFDDMSGDKMSQTRKVITGMANYSEHRELVEGVHLYSELQDSVLVQSVIYTREEYFDNFLKNCGLTYKQWYDAIKQDDAILSSLLFENGYKGKTVATTSILEEYKENIGAMIVVLDTAGVIDVYRQMTKKMPENYFALVAENQVLRSTGELAEELVLQDILKADNMKVLEEDYVVFKRNSEQLDMQYVCVMSQADILDKFIKVKLFLYSMIAVLSSGLMVLAYLFSNVSFGPVREMLSLYHMDDPGKIKDLSELKEFFINVFNSNREFRELLISQEKCIHNNMFRLLIQNSLELDRFALQMIFRTMPISLDSGYFCVVIAKLRILDEHTEERFNFNLLTEMSYITEKLGMRYCTIPNEANKSIFLFAYNQSGANIKAVLMRCNERLKDEKIETIFSIGREITELNDFSKSYEDAVLALNQNGGKIRCYHESAAFLSEKLNIVDKEKLVSYVLAGSTEKVTLYFNELYSIVSEGFLLTYRIQNYIHHSLLEVLNEVLGSGKNKNVRLNKLSEKYQEAVNLGLDKESLYGMREPFLEIAKVMAEQRAGKQKNLDDVILYINENYTIYDLSLKTIAEEMKISYNYLSESFKREMGKTFMKYMHELRSKKAKELLASTELSVAEIGEKCGYLSSNTFIKTFKKLNGMTPGEYRASLKG